MKQKFWVSWIWGAGGILIGLILVAGTCFVSVSSVMKGIFESQFEISNFKFKIARWCGGGLPLVSKLDRLVADKTYIVLLQNNYELRPSGGFAGSYIRLKLGKRGISEMIVRDIYEPDGKLPGHVEPPYPIQEAFGQGWWKLRDANWDADFPKAASDMVWFFEQGGEKPVDGIIAVNLSLFTKILEVMDGVEVITYGKKVTAKNLYSLAQAEAEVGFEPGSTQKRDFLGAVGVAVWEKVKVMKLTQSIKLIKLIKNELGKKDILVWMKDPEIQKEILERGWGGDLGRLPSRQEYLYIVEANLGANKADCCIKRRATQAIQKDEYGIKNKLTLRWQNSNEFSTPKPPVFWGGDLVDYVRVIINRSMSNLAYRQAGVQSVRVDGVELRRMEDKDFDLANSLRSGISWDKYNVEERGDYFIIGFWVKVEAQKSNFAELEYDGDANTNTVFVKKQPGVTDRSFELVVNGETVFSGILDKDKEFSL